jgi:BNR repeat protein
MTRRPAVDCGRIAGRFSRRFPGILPVAIALVLIAPASTSLAVATPSFVGPTRAGFPLGDDWEPSIAADHFGHVYVFWTHYIGFGGAATGEPDPTCPDCGSPHMDLQISSDGGATFGLPRAPFPTSTRQDDPQIVVDPADGRTLYASYMQDNKSSQYVARSDDFGATWRTMLVEPLKRGTDKDILAVRGPDVYLVYHTLQKVYVSMSHDGGVHWATDNLLNGTTNSQFGQSLPSGGAVAPDGTVYFAWNGVNASGQAKSTINLYVTKSTDHGQTWTTSLVDVSDAAPPCDCGGWDYWGAQMALDVDPTGAVDVLWNANRQKYAAQRLYFATSLDGAVSWSPARDVSLAPAGANNVFPALVAGAAGDVRISWFDDRNGHDSGGGDTNARWNVYSRSSTDGGASWSAETQLSAFVPGYPYKLASPHDGFLQPYGDYMELAITNRGKTVAVWGEGNSYTGPGNIWFNRQQ